MEQRDFVKQPLQPFVELTPAACLEVWYALVYALEQFRRWNIEPPPGSWVDEAAAWLKLVHERGSLGATDDELRRTSAAVAVAVDLYHISTSLAEESNRIVAAEIGRVIKGRLLGRGDLAAGVDYLSQFWVGTLLAQSKLKPRVFGYDSPGHRKPDFLVESGRVDFAVEVKRPRNPHSARRSVLTAAAQLRDHGGPGIVIIDATECMSTDPWAVIRQGTRVDNQVREELKGLHRELERVLHVHARSGRVSHIAMLLSFARYWPLQVDEGPSRRAGLQLPANSIPYRWSSQITSITQGIMDNLRDGLAQLTGNPVSYK